MLYDDVHLASVVHLALWLYKQPHLFFSLLFIIYNDGRIQILLFISIEPTMVVYLY